jgi:hypothetical protein
MCLNQSLGLARGVTLSDVCKGTGKEAACAFTHGVADLRAKAREYPSVKEFCP